MHTESKAPFLGRITGSASVDTLVRVGLEKQHGLSPDSRMRVTQDFLATTDDELSAQTGDLVYKLFDENEWVYVISEQGQEGFIPLICVSPTKEASLSSGAQSSSKHKIKQSSSRRKTIDSMLAEEGSDASMGSRENIEDIPGNNVKVDVPPPKPARGLHLDIPDVIGGNQHHHRHHYHPQDQQQQQHSKAQQNSRLSPAESGPETQKAITPLNSHSRTVSTNKKQEQRISLSSSVSGGDCTVDGLQRYHRNGNSSNIPQETPLTSSQTSLSSDPITEVRTFSRKPREKLLVIFPFEAWDEGDMSVDRGEVVTALNAEDPLWTLVRKLNGQEGFVPAAFTCNYPEDLPGGIGVASVNDAQHGNQHKRKPNYHDVRDLLTLRSFIAQSADDISVERGEQVFADLANQIERDWLWVYAPSTGKYGYIPRDNVVHADGTSIPKESEIRNLTQRPP
ncbi:grb2-related adapter protein [Plakobranchus ocellatus]|uniref:Grb2-related adapter protein n=1 Tax=Plakobranchus ocellatus TaxID=259542 RepID=A0AAV3Z2Z5_9GAST|nr:grb2-related adapter protein [Plakobranchus ocellatus]